MKPNRNLLTNQAWIALSCAATLAGAGLVATLAEAATPANPAKAAAPAIQGAIEQSWEGMLAVSPRGLAQHLRQIGAKMYGAYWCGHCQSQKELFGQAFNQIRYIECDPRGRNPQPQLCAQAGIEGYPTWEIRGRKYPGVQPLATLARLSNYRGQ